MNIVDIAEFSALQLKIKELEEENKKLKELAAIGGSRELVASGNTYAFEENIARVQLAKLDSESMNRELTLEEAKKCEIYSKILNNKKNVKDVNAEVRNIDTNKLLESLNG